MSRSGGPADSDPVKPASFDRPLDAYDPTLVLGSVGYQLLSVFNRAGVLGPADVHTAARLCRLAGEEAGEVALAVALAVRAPRVGQVRVDLSTVAELPVVAGDGNELDPSLLPWPDLEPWLALVQASPVVSGYPAGSQVAGPDRPLRLEGTFLYLDRYWRDEVAVAANLVERARCAAGGQPAAAAGATLPQPATPAGAALRANPAKAANPAEAATPATRGAEAIARLFPGEEYAEQARAAATALRGRLAVLAGGPGTGKTTTVARLLAVMFELAEEAGSRPPLIALAAPTGKAAARLEEAVRSGSAGLGTSPTVVARLGSIRGSTLHRLLGSRPDGSGRFRHHRGHRLPHDVVVVDESSMVSLALMARLLEAVRPDAQLILVGDPEQLVSVEAGAVLADIVGPAGGDPAGGDPAGGDPAGDDPAGGDPIGDDPSSDESAVSEPAGPAGGAGGGPLPAAVCVLRRNHRFGGGIAELAGAIRAGDDESVVGVLRGADGDFARHPFDFGRQPDEVGWLPVDAGDVAFGRGEEAKTAGSVVQASVVAWGLRLREVAGVDPAAALAALGESRVLCGHRRGDGGVSVWNQLIEGWLAAAAGDGGGTGSWYLGRPVMVTANDYSISLYNGDSGVVVSPPPLPGEPTAKEPAQRKVAFGEGSGVRLVSPYRLGAAETVYATTVHKSQGSEFDHVTFLLPPAASRLLTRELIYTAVTRARRSVLIVGTEEALRAAVRTPIARASGLEARLRQG